MVQSRFLLVASMAVLVAGACGGASTAPTPSPAPGVATATPGSVPTQPPGVTAPPVGGDIDVCSLLTGAEISGATGLEYTDGTEDTVGQCLWNTVGNTVNTGDLIVGYIQPLDLNFVKQSFGAGGSDATVSGHAAFWNPTQGLGSMWVDLGGGRLFVLSFPRSEDLDSSYLQIAQSLSETALSRLQ